MLGDWLAASENAVIFTGAGISTESGIPDFRSPGGVWTRLKPIMFQDFLADEAQRIEAWRRKFELDSELGDAQPNSGHKVIAALVARGKVAHVITQNIDNLHQQSGIDAARIIELHGNASYAKCLDCGAHYTLDDVRQQFEATQRAQAPLCATCGGFIKSATISFGQPMPEAEMRRAEAACLACDLFIVIGSSLQVYPAAGLPVLAQENGARLVILNREPTPLDALADLVIHAEIGAQLAELDF